MSRRFLRAWLPALAICALANSLPAAAAAGADATAGAGQTSLWKVSRHDSHIFIGATVHALGKSDYPLPHQFDTAYAQAAELILESDRGMTLTRQGKNMLLRMNRLRDGASLQEHLRPDTWRALNRFMADNGAPIEQVSRYKPGMLTILLTMVQKQNLRPLAPGVEAHYLERAFVDGKRVSSFETLFEQMRFFATLGDEDPDAVVRHALEEATLDQQSFDGMVRAWRTGDSRWIEANSLASIRRYPRIYKAVLTDRNAAWMPRIESLFDDDAIEFVLVGSFHLVGPDSLLALLSRLGYRIQKQ